MHMQMERDADTRADERDPEVRAPPGSGGAGEAERR